MLTLCILYNQQGGTYITVFVVIIINAYVSGGPSWKKMGGFKLKYNHPVVIPAFVDHKLIFTEKNNFNTSYEHFVT